MVLRRVISYYRSDGVRITHDPYAPGMAEKYGAPGATDDAGFDPYADTVGPGIYGGTVVRDALGQIVIGQQYQNHNPRPGPVYSGGGYTPTASRLGDAEALEAWLDTHPDLVNDVATGGATPLHGCGMRRDAAAAVAVLVARGADVEAVDAYGYTPLQRMASNNLAEAAKTLLRAGADPAFKGGAAAVARESRAKDVLAVLDAHGRARARVDATTLVVAAAGVAAVEGEYAAAPAAAGPPAGFAAVCEKEGWPAAATWRDLNADGAWFAAPNGAYAYRNARDGCWWIDAPDGAGVYKAPGPPHAPPAAGYEALAPQYAPVPAAIRVYRA